MADINLSKAVRSNLSSLQNTATMMAKTQDRLSTGNKVNSALDNPTNFFTASSLNSRAGDLNNLMDSMANGIKTIEAADNGLTAITKNLESMQSTLRQARQDKSFQTASYDVDSGATGSLSISGGSIGDVAKTVGLTNAVTMGNGGFTTSGKTAGRDGSFTIAATGLNNGGTVAVNFLASDDANAVASKINAKLNGAVGGNGGVSASVVDGQLKLTNSSGNAMTIGSVANTGAQAIGLASGAAEANTDAVLTGTVGTAYTGGKVNIAGVEVTIANGGAVAADNADAAALAINTAFNAAGLTGITATAATGTLTLTRDSGETFKATGSVALLGALGIGNGTSETSKTSNGAFGAGIVTTITPTVVAKTADELISSINTSAGLAGKIRASNDNGKVRIENLSTQALKVGGVNSNGKANGSASTAEIAGNSVRADLAKQFNELRDQLDKLSDDASFNGINLLRGDNLKITFNENGTSSIDIQSKGGAAVNSTNLKLETTLKASDLDNDNGIDTFLDQVKGALNNVRSQASAFGSNLSIVQNRQDFTKSMINTLETGAGNLTLADMNQEAANMMALQTRQSLASSTLSMANQADQNVLQLLR